MGRGAEQAPGIEMQANPPEANRNTQRIIGRFQRLIGRLRIGEGSHQAEDKLESPKPTGWGSRDRNWFG